MPPVARYIFPGARFRICARPPVVPSSEQLAAFAFLKHLGIYGYRRDTLLRLVKFPVSPLENAEKLEQLRALENGIAIAVVKVDYDSIGVDAPEDVKRIEKILWRIKLKAMKKLTYEIVIEREEDQKAGYSVYCPDLPGCFSNGGSAAERKRTWPRQWPCTWNPCGRWESGSQNRSIGFSLKN